MRMPIPIFGSSTKEQQQQQPQPKHNNNSGGALLLSVVHRNGGGSSSNSIGGVLVSVERRRQQHQHHRSDNNDDEESDYFADSGGMPCWYFAKQELRETPSIKDGIPFDKERRYRKEGARFIMTCGTQMGLGHNTIATGIVYFHRFYMFHSFRSFPRYVTACCCLFLAGKVEETPKKCRDIIKVARSLLSDNYFYSFGEDPKEEVMTLERILLQTIKFDLQVEHPYSFLLKYAKCLKGDQSKLQKMVQMAWNFVNDSLSTVVSLQWEPEIIAVALIHLASKLSKFAVNDWTGRQPHHTRWWDMFVSEVTMEILEDICHQVLDLYQSPKETSPPESPPQKPPSRADSPPRPTSRNNSGPTPSKRPYASNNNVNVPPIQQQQQQSQIYNTTSSSSYAQQQQQQQQPLQQQQQQPHLQQQQVQQQQRRYDTNSGHNQNVQQIKSLAAGSTVSPNSHYAPQHHTNVTAIPTHTTVAGVNQQQHIPNAYNPQMQPQQMQQQQQQQQMHHNQLYRQPPPPPPPAPVNQQFSMYGASAMSSYPSNGPMSSASGQSVIAPPLPPSLPYGTTFPPTNQQPMPGGSHYVTTLAPPPPMPPSANMTNLVMHGHAPPPPPPPTGRVNVMPPPSTPPVRISRAREQPGHYQPKQYHNQQAQQQQQQHYNRQQRY